MFIVPISQLTPISSISETQSLDVSAVSGGNSAVPFADVLAGAVQNARETKAVADQDTYKIASGNIDSLEQIMINSSKASIALDTTVQLTTRAVNAYKEIMQMQV